MRPTVAGTAFQTGAPLVSILVPSYNGARFLRESIDSLLAQTYPRVEILLLDDASTDDTPAIAAEYAGRITYVRQPQNLGIYDNVNAGIARAKGEFIATYHADDIYLPGIVDAEVAYLQSHPEVGAVFCSDIFVDAGGREYGRIVLPPPVRGEAPLDYGTVLNALLTYKNRFLVCPTAMVRASVHRDVGVYRQDRYRNTADLEMWLRIARAYPIGVLESHLMRYRHFHGNSSQLYHRLRTAPENFFAILDEYLASGGRALATPMALTAYEAHRSEDRLMAAISHYIKREPADGRRALRQVQLGASLHTRTVQRWRLLLLYAGLWVVLRLPRVEPLARAMFERWHVKQPPAQRA
jgi:glycosyltransferase involved in cell wall biosynthesis